ncbi:MAG: ribose 5-phosphate isomerase B [Opitutales bacterium]|jgi:ribose 5-phosphate isomerase B
MTSLPAISLGSDHGGLALRRGLADALRAKGHAVLDRGTDTDASCDYPDYAQAVGADVVSGRARYGVLVCTTGIGISIAANKLKGVRAALVQSADAAGLSRRHNDANVLCFGAKYVDLPLALSCLDAFLSSEFEGGRHCRRVDKLEP